MGRFRRRYSHEMPGLNLASMPDLIFTVLFFFMIVTHMRQTEPEGALCGTAGYGTGEDGV